MVQLSPDSEAFGGPLLTIEEAAARIAHEVAPVPGVDTVSLDDADGRVLAQDVVAGIDLPPFANSAVDGYAVAHSDLAAEGPSLLPIAGRIAAGADAAGLTAGRGAALRIFTGAPLPAGADTVFMQEDVTLADGSVSLPGGLKRGANARPTGEDIARGEIALVAGRRLAPQDLALLGALGHAAIAVRRRPRVALFSTGNELFEPEAQLPPAAIYDANRACLRAMLRRAGAEVLDLGILRDERESLAARLREAAGAADLILTSGGVSTGEEDHVKAAVEAGGSLSFWRIGIKPGRPVAMGEVGQTPFIGLPGNPVAVFVTFAFIASALVARLGGTTPVRPQALPVRLGFAYRKKAGRREYVRVTLAAGEDGIAIASRYPREGAGVMTSLTRTDGLVELGEDLTTTEAGLVAPFYSYASLTG